MNSQELAALQGYNLAMLEMEHDINRALRFGVSEPTLPESLRDLMEAEHLAWRGFYAARQQTLVALFTGSMPEKSIPTELISLAPYWEMLATTVNNRCSQLRADLSFCGALMVNNAACHNAERAFEGERQLLGRSKIHVGQLVADRSAELLKLLDAENGAWSSFYSARSETLKAQAVWPRDAGQRAQRTHCLLGQAAVNRQRSDELEAFSAEMVSILKRPGEQSA